FHLRRQDRARCSSKESRDSQVHRYSAERHRGSMTRKSRTYHKWTQTEDELLRSLWLDSPLRDKEIARRLKRSTPSVVCHAGILGLKRPIRRYYDGGGHPWTAVETSK